MSPHRSVILSAEFVGNAETVDGILDIGGIKVALGWGPQMPVSVYVRRSSRDLSVMEIAVARHDGLAQEAIDEQNRQADLYPLGPKEYWRGEMVGKWTFGADGHVMTNDDFEADWEEDEP